MRARPSTGRRGRRFTLELPLETPDGFGGVVRTYQPGPQLWGAMELLSGSERFRAGREEGLATHRLTFPFRDGVTAAMQLTLGVRRFRITHAGDPDGRRRALVCLVEEFGP
ncbi:phage head closure protein [uncultured Enterovirga sp.]|uniref:phage head closure protein n=1 Tax=uncultured Enterovirga sp. TaxID=2026352 RepID=UPI0035C9EBFF